MLSLLHNLSGQIPFLLIYLLIFYLFFLRPKNREESAKNHFFDHLAPNDPIITVGGIHGVIRDVEENQVMIALGTYPRSPQMKIQKESISIEATLQVYPREKPTPDPADKT